MSKSLYEEALADAKKVAEVAESKASKAVLEAVMPRIKDLIENQLLWNDSAGSNDSLTELPQDAVTEPDDEGKVTLDLDALDGKSVHVGKDNGEFELSMESKDSLTVSQSQDTFDSIIEGLGSNVTTLLESNNVTLDQISRMISHVEDTYGYVQERLSESSKREFYENELEKFNEQLRKVQENLMSKGGKLNEDQDVDAAGDEVDLDAGGDEGNELTLKLTGLPDDVDLDSVGVDLIGGSEDEGDDVAADDDAGGDDEVLDLDMSGDEDSGNAGDEQAVQLEGNDRIVEIDEGMLRKEIARMKALREEAVPDSRGHGTGADEFDDFGGATEEGEPLDHLARDAEPIAETKAILRREVARRVRLSERMKTLKNEARRASPRRRAAIRSQYNRLSTMFNESVKVSEKHRAKLHEANRGRSAATTRSNNVPQRADNADVSNLRSQLAESKLRSTKLEYANKVLQSVSLNARQRSQVIKALDECKTPREAKLVYETVVKRLASRRPIEESKVIGSSSRPTTRSNTPILNEGADLDRWSQLAGLKK